MVPCGDQKIVIDGDNCFCDTPMWDGREGGVSCHYVERRLVMTKEVFIQCYNAWIKPTTEIYLNDSRMEGNK